MFSNEEINDIIKIVVYNSYLEEFGLLIKGVKETINYEEKDQKDRFISMLLGTLAVSLLGSALAG